MQEITKTQKAINYWLAGEKLKAFAIFKTFKLGLTKDEKRTLEIAHEMLLGRKSFYKQLGLDTQIILVQANSIVRDYIDTYGKD